MDILDIALGGIRGKKLSEPVVIDLDAYGIDLPTLVTSGGGVSEVYGADEIWDKIKGTDNVIFRTAFGITEFRMIPAAKANAQVGFSVVADFQDTLLVANVAFVRRLDDSGESFIRINVKVTAYPPT